MRRLLLYSLLIMFSACQSSLTDDIYMYGDEFELAIGEEVRVGRENSSISFVDVIEDSRCPINVQCVWAGNGKVKLRFNTQDIHLNTYLEPHKINVDEVNIDLMSLEPYPEHPRQFDKEDYKVRLLITKK